MELDRVPAGSELQIDDDVVELAGRAEGVLGHEVPRRHHRHRLARHARRGGQDELHVPAGRHLDLEPAHRPEPPTNRVCQAQLRVRALDRTETVQLDDAGEAAGRPEQEQLAAARRAVDAREVVRRMIRQAVEHPLLVGCRRHPLQRARVVLGEDEDVGRDVELDLEIVRVGAHRQIHCVELTPALGLGSELEQWGVQVGADVGEDHVRRAGAPVLDVLAHVVEQRPMLADRVERHGMPRGEARRRTDEHETGEGERRERHRPGVAQPGCRGPADHPGEVEHHLHRRYEHQRRQQGAEELVLVRRDGDQGITDDEHRDGRREAPQRRCVAARNGHHQRRNGKTEPEVEPGVEHEPPAGAGEVIAGVLGQPEIQPPDLRELAERVPTHVVDDVAMGDRVVRQGDRQGDGEAAAPRTGDRPPPPPRMALDDVGRRRCGHGGEDHRQRHRTDGRLDQQGDAEARACEVVPPPPGADPRRGRDHERRHRGDEAARDVGSRVDHRLSGDRPRQEECSDDEEPSDRQVAPAPGEEQEQTEHQHAVEGGRRPLLRAGHHERHRRHTGAPG